MNGISVRQNAPAALDLLRASSYAYGWSKRCSTAQTLFAILAVAVGAICSFWLHEYKAWAGLFALIVLAIDLVVLEPQKERFQAAGAKIQEMFDTLVLDLPCNEHKVRREPSHEILQRYARKYGNGEKVTRSLLNWYPEVASQVPIEYGRLICQRANMHWDATLRTFVAVGYFVVAGILMISAVVFGLVKHLEVGGFILSALLPLFPSFQKLVREGWRHLKSAAVSNECREQLEAIWKRCLQRDTSELDLLEVSRRLQDELYDRRRSAPPVPNWLYGIFRDGFEAEMKHAAKVLVDAVQNQLTSVPAEAVKVHD